MDQVDAFPSPQSAGWECVEHQGALPKALGLRLGSGGPPEPGVQDGQGWIRARTEEMLGTGSSCTCTLPGPGTTGSWAFCGQSLLGGGVGEGGEGTPAAQRAQLREATRRPGCRLDLGGLGVSSGLVVSHLQGGP